MLRKPGHYHVLHGGKTRTPAVIRTSIPAHEPPADVRMTRASVAATIPGYMLGRNPPGDPARTVIWRRFIT